MIRLDGTWKRLLRSRAPLSRPALAPLTAALLLAGGSAARADVTPALGSQTLGTVVNQNCGTAAAFCSLGITGGTSAGANLFHRFQSFDTRSNGNNGAITGVTFQNGSTVGNVIVGVLSPTHINVPVNLLNAANLFWLSPAGLTISGNGSFGNVNSLTLSTATGLKLSSVTAGTQTFDAVQTSSTAASQLGGTPQTGSAGLVTDPNSLNQLIPPLSRNGDIVLQDGLLTVDQSLLLDAQGGDVRLQNLTISGAGVLTLAGNSFWNGGTITGLDTLVVPAGATLSLDGGVKQFGNTILDNAGTIAWISGDILQTGDSTINNAGIFDIRADVTIGANIPNFSLEQNSVYNTQFNNQAGALLSKTAGSGIAYLGGDSTIFNTIGSVNINNLGTIDVSSGTLISASGTFSQAGTLNVGPGASFGRAQGITNLATGILSGGGSIDVGNANALVNLGTISPGGSGSLGTLSILGNVNFGATSQLEIDLGSTNANAGPGSDRLTISGSALLAGSLLVNPPISSSPPTSADVITAAAMTGGFDPGTSSLPSGVNGAIVNDGTVYRLTSSGLPCSGVCWDGGGGADTNWATAANWTGDLLPKASDLVSLNLVEGSEVSLTNSQTVAALFSSANNNLSILNGGNLVLASTDLGSQLDGGLSIAAGGSLRSNADLAITGTYRQSGGSINTAGSLTIGSSGGPVQISNASLTGGTSLTITGVRDAQQPNGVTISGSQLKAGGDGLSINSLEGRMELGGTFQSDSSVLLRSDQGVRLTSGSQISAIGSGDPLVIVTGSGPFLNEAGSSALNISGGGRWLLYADGPAGSNLGGLPLNFKQYGKSFGDTVPILGTGNGLLYGISPVINVSLVNVSKVYDGTGTALLTAANLPLSGVIDNDLVVVSATGNYITAGSSPVPNPLPKDVGTGKLVTANATLASATSSIAQGSVPVYGYQLSPSTLTNASGSISPRELPLSGLVALDKIYDGTSIAPLSGTATVTPLSGDSVSLVGAASGAFSDRNVGVAKPVSVGGVSLGGTAAGNYSLVLPSDLSASITPLTVVAGFTAADKIYDGGTAAVISSRSLNGAISGDAVSLSGGSASFADRNVGPDKVVTASGFSLSGADAGNYRLASDSSLTLAAISIRPLATWQSTSGGNWSDAANWDALPDGNNVATVLIPAGSGPVVFDAGVGPTTLEALNNQGRLALNTPGLTLGQLFNSGSLDLATDLSLNGVSGRPTFAQNGGNLSGPAALNILAGSGSWSGGLWSGNGQVRLSPGSSLTLEGDGSRWGGRTLVVQAGGGNAVAAAVTINGTTTATGGDNAIVNRGLTTLNGANLSRSGGSLQLQNSGTLISNAASSVNGELVNSGGAIQVNSGSLRLNGGGSDSNGSVQVADGAELVWGVGDRSLLGGTRFSSDGSGRFRLAGANLTAAGTAPLLFDAPLLVDSGTLRGSGSLTINGGYRQSGGQISGFSNVAINQPQGSLQISGAGRDTASIIAAPGGAISLRAPAGSIALSDTGLDARGSSVGGSILLEAAAEIQIDRASLQTSGRQTGGRITIGNASNPPVLTAIRNSNLIADPPASGGVINIYGQTILIEGSNLNLYGDSGGALVAGNSQTSQLSIDRNTRIIAGPGATISCAPDRGCDQARIERSGTPPAPAPEPPSQPLDQALANLSAAIVLNASFDQTPLSNDAQTSSQVQQAPTPLLSASSGGSGQRRPLDLSLDQAASFSPDLFPLSAGRNSLAATTSNPAVQQSLEPAAASTAAAPLGERPVSTISSGETRENFTTGTARSQQDTARGLGLSDAEQNAPPSIEDLQKAMREITQWMRSRQPRVQTNDRRCGGEGQAKCPS